MSKTIEVVDYDPQWIEFYEEEKRRILKVVGNIIVRIEHIGSTAGHDLGAKTIIDMMIAVPHLSDAAKCI